MYLNGDMPFERKVVVSWALTVNSDYIYVKWTIGGTDILFVRTMSKF